MGRIKWTPWQFQITNRLFLPPSVSSSHGYACQLVSAARGMIDLIPESVKDKFNNTIVAIHRRDPSSDSSSSGLLSPVGTPRLRLGHKRQLSLSSFNPRKSSWTAAAITLLTIISLWWSFGPVRRVGLQAPEQQDDNGPIPLGQSRYLQGREVFWWSSSLDCTACTAGARISFPSLNTFPNSKLNLLILSNSVLISMTSPSSCPLPYLSN